MFLFSLLLFYFPFGQKSNRKRIRRMSENTEQFAQSSRRTKLFASVAKPRLYHPFLTKKNFPFFLLSFFLRLLFAIFVYFLSFIVFFAFLLFFRFLVFSSFFLFFSFSRFFFRFFFLVSPPVWSRRCETRLRLFP